MIIEREGVKFYAPDSATSLVNGAWAIDDSQLVLWDVHIATIQRDELLAEKTQLESELSTITLASASVENADLLKAVEQYNEPLYAQIQKVQDRIDYISSVTT